MQNKELQTCHAEDPGLLHGHRIDRQGTDIRVLDPNGRRVARFSNVVTVGEEGSDGVPVELSVTQWQRLCGVLLLELSRRDAKCEELRTRETAIAERLEAVEAERDQANAIAEDLYGFFRDHMRSVYDKKKSVREQERCSF